MSAILKFILIAAACFGVYCFLGSYLPDSHKFAFGLGGMGFTWLIVGTVITGGVAYKFLK
jgi:hypothetical protein